METRHIIVGTDFSSAADAALDCAIALAGPGCQITLVHVCELEVERGAFDVQSSTKPRVELLRKCHEQLAATIARRERAGVQLGWLLTTGLPWEKLEELAIQTDADAIVIGRAGATLGVVAKHMLRRSSCPVLCVPSASFEYQPTDLGREAA